MHREPRFEFDGFVVRRGQTGDAVEIVDYFSRNKEHLLASSAIRTEEFYTPKYWEKALRNAQEGFEKDRLAHCFIFREKQVIGVTNLSNFVRGAFHACLFGYSIDADYQGKGIMFEAASRVVDYAFNTLGMHRVMANYMPDNERSGRLLQRLEFKKEGFAEQYLLINGKWRDHILTAKTNPDWKLPEFQAPETHVSLPSPTSR